MKTFTSTGFQSLFAGNTHLQFYLKANILISLILLGTTVSTSSQVWNELESGLNGPVTEIYPYGSDVYVGGYFFDAGGNEDADFIARWDGCEWHAVAPGLNATVTVITISGDTVYVAGNFTDVGGNTAIDGIAFWDGTKWNNIGAGLDYYVTEMIVLGGDLYVGGGFNGTSDGQYACLVARWDGHEWHALGSGPLSCAYDFAYVSDMATDGTDLYVAGLFYDMGGVAEADRVARWDGNAWHSLGLGIDDGPLWYDDLQIEINQEHVYISGQFTNAGGNPDADYIVKWDGNAWHGLSESLADSNVSRITLFNENLYCAVYRPDFQLSIIYMWNTQDEAWETFDSLAYLIPMIADSNSIYVGGYFEEINGEGISHIARWGSVEDCTSALNSEMKDPPIEIQTNPNPSNDILYFSTGEDNFQSYTLRVTNLTGHTMSHIKSSAGQVEVSSLAAGVYFLLIQSSDRIGISKFIKY